MNNVGPTMSDQDSRIITSAYETIHANRKILYRVAEKILIDYGRAFVDEAYLEAIERIARAYKIFNPNISKFTTWACTIVHNVSVNKVKKLRYPTKDIDDPNLEAAITSYNCYYPSFEDFDEDTTQRDEIIHDELTKLPEGMREIVRHCGLYGVPTKVYAESTGKNEGTVKSQLSRGKQKLKEALLKYEIFERCK